MRLLTIASLLLILAASATAYTGFSPIQQFTLSSQQLSFSEAETTKTITLSAADDIIYQTYHVSIDGANWQPYTFPEAATNSWISTGSATASITIPRSESTDHYVITYTCSRNEQSWDCHDSKWQIRQVNTTLEECTPSCTGKQCGPDGCGGSCGSCADGQSCTGHVCTNNTYAIPPLPAIPGPPDVQANGITYYVDQDTGNNANTKAQAQNPSTPWKTIQHGVNQIAVGDTLIVGESATAYQESVVISKPGDAAHWTVIKGTEGERPTVNGTYNAFNLYNTSSYVKIENFKLLSATRTGIKCYEGMHHFMLNDIEIDGKGTMAYGITLGSDYPTSPGVDNGYISNIDIHDTANYGVLIDNGAENIVFDNVTSRGSKNSDGFAGRTTPSEHAAGSITRNLYFIDSQAYGNAGDGFDIGSGTIEVFLNCKSYSNGGVQGNGYKVWGGFEDGGEIWIINSVAYNNDYPAVSVKNYGDADVYLLHNTFVKNEAAGGGSEIQTVNNNGEELMNTPHLYLYNNLIYSSGGSAFFSIYNNDTYIEGADNNYYFADSDKKFYQVRNDDGTATNMFYLSEVHGTWGADTTYGALNKDAGSIVSYSGGTPGFVDMALGDFRLSPGSPAIDAGVDVGLPYNGAAPDIGAYEYAP